jgi:aerobic C4-dicarboxylate transport protein
MIPPSTPGARPRPIWTHLYVQVLAAIVLGTLIGWLAPATGEALKPLGDGFIKLVKMIIAPVIFLTVVTGIAGGSGLAGVGAGRGQGVRLFPDISTLALIVGLLWRIWCARGRAWGSIRHPRSGGHGRLCRQGARDHVTGFLLAIIPDTLLGASPAAIILQVLLVAILSRHRDGAGRGAGGTPCSTCSSGSRWSCSGWSRS